MSAVVGAILLPSHAVEVTEREKSGGRPNIVLIMADDIGPGDLGFYHRKRTGKPEVIPTPNLDRLIAEGIRFDDAHSAASLCAPSRFGMLTGSYSYRNYRPYGVWGPSVRTGVDPKYTTTARIARNAGYATAFFGKSGMGGGFKVADPETAFSWKKGDQTYDLAERTNGPNQWGFDYALELPSGIQNQPFAFYENGKWMPLKPDSTWKMIGPKQNRYDTSRKHNNLSQLGDSNWDPTRAGPILAEKAQAYIRRQTEASPDQPFFIYYCSQAVHIPHTPPAELNGVKLAGTTPGPHGDMVRELDVQVGMLVKALKDAGVHDNTLFIFTSDNGGLAADPEAKELGHDPTDGWRGIKGQVSEGGHRVPFIATWPGVIAPGTRSEELISALDTVATIAAVTGQEISRAQVMDAVDLLPLLRREPGAKGHAVLVHYNSKGMAALRQGDWKLHVFGKHFKKLKPTHLYNLAQNPGEDEVHDLINDPEQQRRVQEMMQIFKDSLKKPTADFKGVPMSKKSAAITTQFRGTQPDERLLVDFATAPVPIESLEAESDVADGALSVTFPAAGAGVSLALSEGGLDLSAYASVAVAIENTGPAPATITGTLDGKQTTSAFLHLPPRQSGTMLIFLPRKGELTDRRKDQFTGMRGVPGGHMSHWAGPDPSRIRSLVLRDLDGASVGATVRIRTIHARYRYGPLDPDTEKTFFPFVDRFGQYRHGDWPGKTGSVADLATARTREEADLAAHPGPAQRSRYGGWLEGPKLKASGHFRTEKVDGKWWLVDPEGYLFWSHGITGVHNRGGRTKVAGREHYFEVLPEAFLEEGNLNLCAANLQAKYGEDWPTATMDLAHQRLRSWGMNTIANWSDEAVCSQKRTPYVKAIHYTWAKGEEGEHLWKDPEALRRTLTSRMAMEQGKTSSDPWCIGYFVDNELRWHNVMPAEEYYRIVREVVKRAAPDKLYLGSRLHGQMHPHGGPQHAAAAAARYCDVVGINRYRFSPSDLQMVEGADVPIIIGEFHFGALDRGMLHTGLRAVPSQAQRAHAYTHYLTEALKHPHIVGTHWFQYREQAVTGRADGENFQIGFVDICDTPYPEIIDAARRIGDRMYQRRSGGKQMWRGRVSGARFQ